MRDAAWAYVKLKRMEVKTFSPKFAWINYNRIIPEKIGKSLFEKKLLKKIGDSSERDYFRSIYKYDSEKNSYLLSDDLEIEDYVKAREIFIWYKLPPFYSLLQRIKKLPEFIIYNFIDAICGFGENLSRILISLAFLILGFAAYTKFFNGLKYKESNLSVSIINHLIFSLGNLTGTKPERIVAANSSTELLLSLQSFFGIALVGLFGFVLGNKIRNR